MKKATLSNSTDTGFVTWMFLFFIAMTFMALMVSNSHKTTTEDDSEIDAVDYRLLAFSGPDCYPEAKQDIKNAMQDGKITKKEYHELNVKCYDYKNKFLDKNKQILKDELEK